MQDSPSPQSASAASASLLPEDKRLALRRRVAARLQASTEPAVEIQAMQVEQRALAQALREAAVLEAASQGFQTALAVQAPGESNRISDAQARLHLQGILQRRANDAEQAAALLGDAAFVSQAQAESVEDAAPYQLSPRKKEEIIRRLVQEADRDGPEPTIHVAASAAGQRQWHQALAALYAADGPLRTPLEAALRDALPEAQKPAASALAEQWLQMRREPAQAVAEGLQENGALFREALQRAQEAAQRRAAAPLRQQLLASTMLTPAQQEHHKSAQQKAEDVIYTLNHALTCLGITDTIVQPAVAALSLRLLGKRIDLCGHLPDANHDHHEGHHHEGHHHEHDHGHGILGAFKRWHTFKEFMIGELAGDVGAVLPTLALQRFFPGFMHGLRRCMEPLVGGWFRASAERGAKHWAQKHGLAADDPQAIARAQQLYEYEVSHLPQMAVWTASSIGINYGVMKYRNPGMKLTDFLAVKSLGSLVTAGLVLAGRAASPTVAHGWDETVSRNLIVPATKILGAPFGVRGEEVEAAAALRKGSDAPQLQGRVTEENSTRQAVA